MQSPTRATTRVAPTGAQKDWEHDYAKVSEGGEGDAGGGGGPAPPSPIWYTRERDPFSRFATATPTKRLMHNPSTAPASERGPAPSLASYLRSCLLPLSGQPGLIRAAWAMPRRVPARGRGRETELCIILYEGEQVNQKASPTRAGRYLDHPISSVRTTTTQHCAGGVPNGPPTHPHLSRSAKISSSDDRKSSPRWVQSDRIARQHDRGRLTIRERIDKLLDPGSFREIGTFAVSEMHEVRDRTPGDGQDWRLGQD